MYKTILLIQNLYLPDDINNIIKYNYKYDMLCDTYKRNYKKVMVHLLHYVFLNKKLNKKDKSSDTLLKTIYYFDN